MEERANSFVFGLITEADARQIATWQYDAPYEVYNSNPNALDEHVQSLLKPTYHYHTIRNTNGELIGYCCFGEDARVTGGDYEQHALDVGAGMRPDLTGQQQGHHLLNAILAFAQTEFTPAAFRVTIASWNKRALKVAQKVGFHAHSTFLSASGVEFAVLVK